MGMIYNLTSSLFDFKVTFFDLTNPALALNTLVAIFYDARFSGALNNDEFDGLFKILIKIIYFEFSDNII